MTVVSVGSEGLVSRGKLRATDADLRVERIELGSRWESRLVRRDDLVLD